MDGKCVGWSQKDVITSKCFRHVIMYPSIMDLDDSDDDNDHFAGEELLDFEALVRKISKKVFDVAAYVAISNSTDTYHSLDTTDSY